jgi:hypothetical protein
MSRIHTKADTTKISTSLESILFEMLVDFLYFEIQGTILAYPGQGSFPLVLGRYVPRFKDHYGLSRYTSHAQPLRLKRCSKASIS